MTTTAPPASRARGAQPVASAVSVVHVSKAFRLPHQRYHTLKERVLHPFRGNSYDVLQAVDDVNVEIPMGEFFGVVGRNGSGKSTLLKCIAGIYGIDSGELQVRGRLSPFIELGVGFNMDLTARDNIVINAIMLGLSRRQTRERFDQIIMFAGLEEFLDLKLKNYSSGMLVRLAFSVAIQVEAEILLIDEVLAVGDAAFQQKCFDEFERLKREQRTIVFVTHDMGAVERFCDRAMLLERGRVVEIGDPGAVARRYIQINVGRTVHQLDPDAALRDRAGARPAAQIVDAWFEGPDGARIAETPHGEPVVVCVEVTFNKDLVDPVFGVTLRNEWGATIFAATTDHSHKCTGRFTAGETAIVRLRFENWLVTSRYTLTPSIALGAAPGDAIEVREDIASLAVLGGPYTGAVVNLPHSFEIARP